MNEAELRERVTSIVTDAMHKALDLTHIPPAPGLMTRFNNLVDLARTPAQLADIAVIAADCASALFSAEKGRWQELVGVLEKNGARLCANREGLRLVRLVCVAIATKWRELSAAEYARVIAAAPEISVGVAFSLAAVRCIGGVLRESHDAEYNGGLRAASSGAAGGAEGGAEGGG